MAAEIGAPEARVHDLRHTFAVISLQNGDDVKTVQENLGQASASFTLDVYGHVSDRMKKEVLREWRIIFVSWLSSSARKPLWCSYGVLTFICILLQQSARKTQHKTKKPSEIKTISNGFWQGKKASNPRATVLIHTIIKIY